MQQSPDTKFARDAMAAFPYRQLIGSLVNLMVATRPDLTFLLVKVVDVQQQPQARALGGGLQDPRVPATNS